MNALSAATAAPVSLPVLASKRPLMSLLYQACALASVGNWRNGYVFADDVVADLRRSRPISP